MKSFIFALLLLLSVSLFVTVNAVKTVSRIDQMLAIAKDLPKNEADFISANGTADKVNALISLWDKEFPSIVYTRPPLT